jgi:phosphonate transport system substrate-binding protein
MKALKTWSLLMVAALALAAGACQQNEGQDSKDGATKEGEQTGGEAAWPRDGSKENPLVVMLVPADGGTEEGTKKDFEPVFNAITKAYGLNFDIKVGQTYGAVIEAQANGQVDIGFFGAVSYLQCKERGGVELLAVSVEKGQSVYYSGIFVPKDSPIKELKDLKGKSMAFGDPSSTSSFNYPAAMLIDAGVDPVKDLGKVVMAGSHVNSLKACAEGKVEACAASFDSLEKAINQKQIGADALRPLTKSEPIPNPPLAMHPKLPAEMKAKLRDAFKNVHKAEGVTPDMIRGYGGKKCDRYDTEYSEQEFMKAAAKLDKVDKIKGEILAKAAEK